MENKNSDNKEVHANHSPSSYSGGNYSTNSKASSKKDRRIIFLIFAFSILIIIGLIVLAGIVNKKSTAKLVTGQTSTESPDPGFNQTQSQLQDYNQEATIELTSSGPLPQELTVTKNTKIIWQNKDVKDHKLAIVAGESIPTGFYNNRIIAAGDGYPYVAAYSGTFHYYFVDDPSFVGTVIVK